MHEYERLVIGALRDTLARPIGYIDQFDDKYGNSLSSSSGDQKQRRDPTAPYHPIWNPGPRPEPTFADYLLAQEREKEQKREQRKQRKQRFLDKLNHMALVDFEQVLQQRDSALSVPLVVGMLRNHTWKSATGFAAHLFKPSYWAKPVGKLLEREGLLQPGEFKKCFTDRRGRSGVAVRRTKPTAVTTNNQERA